MDALSRHGEEEKATAAAGCASAYTSLPALAAVLDASPDVQILLAADQTILFANAAFHATNPDEAGPLVGQSLAASLMGRDARRAASRRLVLSAVRQALAEQTVVRPPPFRYDIQKDLSVAPREAWWRLSASPFELDGRGCLLLTVCEVTAAVTLGRGAAPEGLAEEPDDALVWSERRRLGQMFEQATDMLSLVVGPDHVFELINPAMQKIAGDVQMLGRSMRDMVQSERGREIIRQMDRVRATGRPYVAHAQPFRTFADPEKDRYLDLSLQPLTNEAAKVEAIFCRGRDVTEQVHALKVQQFLREELAHRQGNILAVVLALAEQSAAQAPSLDQFRTVFAGRLSALAAVNILLNREGPDVSLAALLGALPHPQRSSIRISGGGAGAKLTPKAAITLGLMLHELLHQSGPETPDGSTRPRIRAHRRGDRLHLVWLSPALRGFDLDGDDFARRLIDHAVRHEFGGRWAQFRRKNGAAVCFEFPLNHSAWAGAHPVA
ncbi:MAG: two-component sensor histidine kinase [Brevundimonas sp.]|jgi:two-component sensor histidine kinase|uniref:PAS domain-containing protein n=1 Tax=Brevundimonas sp. TaxID=1871086 RepID=UPI0039E3F34B